MKDQVKRSLKELQIYQMRFPSPHSTHFNAIQSVYEEDDYNFNWAPSSEKLQPLFQAYDIRNNYNINVSNEMFNNYFNFTGIAELEDSNRQHSSVIDSFKQNV